MSYPSHLICINKHYYYRISIPVDLRHYFPVPIIQKTLNTINFNDAKQLLLATEYKVQKTFALLRTGMLDNDTVHKLLYDLVSSKGRVNERNGVKSKQDKAVKSSTALSEVINRYVEAKQAEWTSKSKMEFNSVFKLLIDILGDVDVTSITKPMVTELRSTLQKLPPNIYKKYPGQSIQQILSCKDEEAMSIKSVNKHISRLGALLRYCVDEGVISSNPASGLKISDKKRADEERNAYSKDDVKKIINAVPRDSKLPERYWIPLIGLYSGMRLNEICQMYVSDIIKFDGYWCISINAEKDKRLKNTASERVIPIHPVLLELGFLEYVECLQLSNSPRLWMNLAWTDLTGYGNSFCKWYQRFNRIHVTDDPMKVFHSMRHLVADTLKQAGVEESLIAELVGHSTSGSMTMGRYGKRYQPKVLLEAMKKLDYGIQIDKKHPNKISVPGHTTVTD